MASEKEFQQKIRELGARVAELDNGVGSGAMVSTKGVAAKELVQLLMEVHGAGLERIMEIVFGAGPQGEAIIAALGEDPIVRNLLLLYSLHPDDLQTRVARALSSADARLRKFDSKVELVRIQDGSIRLRLESPESACGSTVNNMQSIVEECIYELAPDLTSLEILSSREEVRSGFVPLEQLVNKEQLKILIGAEQAVAVHPTGLDSMRKD